MIELPDVSLALQKGPRQALHSTARRLSILAEGYATYDGRISARVLLYI